MPNSSYFTLEAFVGDTPLARLQRLPGDTTNIILGKLEGNHLAGSVKDRPALSMIQQVEARGDIRPGDTPIEATSGNTGIALAMIAAIKGYRLVWIMPENQSAILDVTQAEAETIPRRLARQEGICCGVSAGGTVAATLRLSQEVENAVIVTIICDRGDRYLSTGLFGRSMPCP